MTTNKDAFETLFPMPKVFSSYHEQQKLIGQWHDCRRGWMTATTEANKRIAELEREVAIARSNENHADDQRIKCIRKYKTQITELQANNHDLREALKYTLYSLEGRGIPAGVDPANLTVQYHKCKNILQQALTATPAESLQAHDDELIEKCAKVCEENFKPFTYDAVAEAIRALKEVK